MGMRRGIGALEVLQTLPDGRVDLRLVLGLGEGSQEQHKNGNRCRLQDPLQFPWTYPTLRRRGRRSFPGVEHPGSCEVAPRYFFSLLSPVATRARVARRRKSTEKQVSQVVLNHSVSLPQEPSAAWAPTSALAPSAYQKWSPSFSVPNRIAARSSP